MTGTEIEELYNSRFLHPFPYDDCYWLRKQAKRGSWT